MSDLTVRQYVCPLLEITKGHGQGAEGERSCETHTAAISSLLGPPVKLVILRIHVIEASQGEAEPFAVCLFPNSAVIDEPGVWGAPPTESPNFPSGSKSWSRWRLSSRRAARSPSML